MATDPGVAIQELDRRVERRERVILLGTVLTITMLIVGAGILLWITLAKVSDAQSKLDRVNQEFVKATRARDNARAQAIRLRRAQTEAEATITDLEEEVRTLQRRLREVQTELNQSTRFARHVYNIDWTDVKRLASQFRGSERPLLEIASLRERGVRWGFGNRPSTGFDSPGFAGYVLQELGVSPRRQDPVLALYRLEQTRGRPEVGDIVVYEAGYTMFYFCDRMGRDFVVGMTPVGIVALEPNFGPAPLSVLRAGRLVGGRERALRGAEYCRGLGRGPFR